MNDRTFYRRVGKRMLDIVLSVVALLVLAPLLMLLALLVAVFLGRPIFFKQRRSGRGQMPFTMVKFRTMTDARDAAGNRLPDSARLTRFGRLLRATSLDELPELWNVLVGDMSLVGPRPLLPRYDASYDAVEMRRFDVRPGITGWAQINGRNDVPWDERLALDVWYVQGCSLFLDVKILCLTVLKVLCRANVQVNPDLGFGYLDEERRLRSGVALVAQQERPAT